MSSRWVAKFLVLVVAFLWQASAHADFAAPKLLALTRCRSDFDGGLVLQEQDSYNNPQVTYTRGLDLSLSVHGAGGIGGLLARTDANGSTFYHAEGSGNITSLIDGSQNIAARYRYDGFGKLLGRWGSLADSNHMRFSSMEYFPNAGIYGYQRRFYEPNFQRWLNRDPIAEAGGINLYGFAGNSPVEYLDPFGLDVPSMASVLPWVNPTVWNNPQYQAGALQGESQMNKLTAGLIGGTAAAAGGIALIAPEALVALGITAVELAETPEGQEEMEELEGEVMATTSQCDTAAQSSLQGSRLSQQLSAEEAAGVRAPTRITDYSDHALEQITARDGGIGVSEEALEDAFANPNAIDYAPSKYGPTFRFAGNDATVVVNQNGTVVTGWATGSGGIER